MQIKIGDKTFTSGATKSKVGSLYSPRSYSAVDAGVTGSPDRWGATKAQKLGTAVAVGSYGVSAISSWKDYSRAKKEAKSIRRAATSDYYSNLRELRKAGGSMIAAAGASGVVVQGLTMGEEDVQYEKFREAYRDVLRADTTGVGRYSQQYLESTGAKGTVFQYIGSELEYGRRQADMLFQTEADRARALEKAARGGFFSKALGFVGSVIGGFFGGPTGAAIGGSIGETVGGAAS